MTSTAQVTLRVEDGIAKIELSNPKKLNAIDEGMLRSLDETLDRIESDEQVRVLLIQGAGGQMFSSGADVAEWSTLSPYAMGSRWIRKGNEVFNRIERLDTPSIAVMNGNAFGGGLELALACDLRYAAADAKLALPESKLGAIAGWNGCSRLLNLVGIGRAREMALLGGPIAAEKALRWGLINDIFPTDQLSAAVEGIARTMASRSAVSLSVTKRILRAVSGDSRDVLHEFAASVCKGTADASEGVAAFYGKRPPVFGDREVD